VTEIIIIIIAHCRRQILTKVVFEVLKKKYLAFAQLEKVLVLVNL